MKIFVVIFLLALAGCHSKEAKIGSESTTAISSSEKNSKNKGPAKSLADYLAQLDGSCERGLFSPDGQNILVLCSGREGAMQSQLYEINLARQQERRITWQDGMIESADWIDDKHVVYASTTDELKEIPFLKIKPASEDLPAEIYSSDLVGDDIQRLTDHSGFNGDISVYHPKKEIYFVARESAQNIIQKKTLHAGGNPENVVRGEPMVRKSPAVLSNGHLAWLELAPSKNSVDLHISGHKHEPRLKDRLFLRVRTSPTGKTWLVIETSAAKNGSEVILVGEEKDCERTLFETPLDLRFVDAQLNPPRLLLTASEGGKAHLFLKDLPEEAFTCAAPAPPARVVP